MISSSAEYTARYLGVGKCSIDIAEESLKKPYMIQTFDASEGSGMRDLLFAFLTPINNDCEGFLVTLVRKYPRSECRN